MGSLRLSLVVIAMITGCGTDADVTMTQNQQKMDQEQASPSGLSFLVAFRIEHQHGLPLLENSPRNAQQLLHNLIESQPGVTEGIALWATDLNFGPRNKGLGWSLVEGLQATSRSFNEPEPALISRIDFRSTEEAEGLLQYWREAGLIYYAEPNGWNRPQNEDVPDGHGRLEHWAARSTGWWHQMIGLDRAFRFLAKEMGAGNLTSSEIFDPAPVIAIMDSGIDFEHPMIKPNRFEIGAAEADAVNCPGGFHGCDATRASPGRWGVGSVHPYGVDGFNQPCSQGQGDREDRAKNCGHGTHVAAIAAGVFLEQSGVGGICPMCRILGIKVVTRASGQKGGGAPDSAILAGMKYLAEFGEDTNIRVLNTSFGTYTKSRSIALATKLLSDRGIVIVSAAGNEDSIVRSYPASLADVIAVSGVTNAMGKARYSNYGSWVDVAAPGGIPGGGSGAAVVAAIPGQGETDRDFIGEGCAVGPGLGCKAGTSMASPVVAGLIGLGMTYPPIRKLPAAAVRARLMASANFAALYPGDTHPYFRKPQKRAPRKLPLLGAGLVDAEAFLQGGHQGFVGQENDRVKPHFACAISPGVERTPGLIWGPLLLLPVVLGIRLQSKTFH